MFPYFSDKPLNSTVLSAKNRGHSTNPTVFALLNSYYREAEVEIFVSLHFPKIMGQLPESFFLVCCYHLFSIKLAMACPVRRRHLRRFPGEALSGPCPARTSQAAGHSANAHCARHRGGPEAVGMGGVGGGDGDWRILMDFSRDLKGKAFHGYMMIYGF